MIILGIDLGKDGALAILYPDGRIETHPFKNNYPGVIRAIYEVVKRGNVVAAIEDLGAVYGSRASSTFSFGWSCGFMEGVLTTLGVKYVKVKPVVWQEAVTVPRVRPKTRGFAPSQRAKMNKAHKEAIKKESLRCACNAFPMADIRHDGVADAVNIARWLKQERRI